jgi:hypothetical protein
MPNLLQGTTMNVRMTMRMLALAMVAMAWGCEKSVDWAATSAPAEPPAMTQWQWQDVTAGDQTARVEVVRFAEPRAFRTVRLDRVSRDTPLNTWVAFQSYQHLGRSSADLTALANLFTDGPKFLESVGDRGHATAEAYFDALRELNVQPEVIGLIRYKGEVLVVYCFRGGEGLEGQTFTSAAHMVPVNGRSTKWYIQWPAEETDPIFKKLQDKRYAILDGPLP